MRGTAVEGGNAGVRLAAGLLAVLLGSAAQLQQPALWRHGAYAALGVAGGVLALACWRWRARAWPGLALGLAVTAMCFALAVGAMAFALAGLRAHGRVADRLDPALEGRDLVVSGLVAEMPRRADDGVRFTFAVEAALLDGRSVRVPAQLALGWYGARADEASRWAPHTVLRAGQRWRLPVRLKQPHGSVNPHGFDSELWMFERGLGASGSVRGADAQLLERDAGARLERWREQVRDAIFARVADARAAGVLAALAVGDQGSIERADWDLFRATGIAHLVSISGLHVTMFAWLAAALIGRAWRVSPRAMHAVPAPTAARWGGLAAAAMYALVAGWGVPAQRTVWMLAGAALLAHGGRRWPWPLVLLAVAAWVAALDPWALLQPGFWLSFVAVGLLLVAEPGERGDRGPGIAHALRHGLRTQVIATLGLAPLTLVFFQQLSVVGFVANLAAIPLITLLVTPLALVGVWVAPAWSLAAALVQALVRALGTLADLPWAVWNAAVAPWWMQACALLGAALLVMPLPWRLRALALPLMLPLFAPPLDRVAPGELQLLVADVGQGSAILVRTRTRALLHDTGAQWSADSDAGSRILVPLLRAQGVARLDLLMLSHRDADHVGGAAAILRALAVARVSSSLEAGHPLLGAAREHTRCEAGQTWHWDGVELRVLHPRAEDYARADAKPNTLSCVLRLTDAHGRRVLLTGDLEAEQEQRLVREDAAALRADVLLVPHHGSRTSSSAAFLDAVAPRVAIVQAGYRNRFGHPAPAVVARYAERGIVLLDSAHCGAWNSASATLDADPHAACERARRPRYWHHGVEVAVPASGSARVIEREMPP